jgi:hypothetical protein
MSKNVALLLVFVFLAASCLIMVNLVAVTSQDTTLGFLTDVAGVDVAKYRIEETGVPSKVLGGVVDQRVKYRFEVDGSKMEVISNLKKWCPCLV